MRRHVFEDETLEGTSRFSAASLSDTGCLRIEIHDSGIAVESFLGDGDEFESVRTLSPTATLQLQRLLGGRDLLATIASTFASAGDLVTYLNDHDIPSDHWSHTST